jgi:hypothetical protein
MRIDRMLRVAVVLGVLFGATMQAREDVFERACVACHERAKVPLRKTFMNALLIYGGKENMKAGLKYFLRHPRRDSSVMSEAFLDRYGVKEPLDLNDTVLDRALDLYWERYKVIGNLR